MTSLLLAGCIDYESPAVTATSPEELNYPLQLLSILRTDIDDNYDDYDDYDYCDDDRPPVIPAQSIKIGVTHPSHDDVGLILNFFGSGVDFYELTGTDLRNLERLKEFYAIFINCGSHSKVDSRVLRSYVAQGGVVYASDLAGAPLTEAFPDIFEYRVVDPSLTVRSADIPHTSLASHMGISQLDVIFNMDGWYVITELSENATTYIQGYVPGHGTAPLAISFDYGYGTVFYTSFHNNAQATSDMVNFIEYLVFRIKFIEADRGLALRAESEGFVYRGAVFGFFARSSAPAGAMAPSVAEFSIEAMDMDSEVPMAAEPAWQPSPEFFQYTFSEGEDFMLMIEAGGESFTLRLYDPFGNTYYLTQQGQLISYYLTAGPPALSPIFESTQGYGVRVRNVAGGQWGFTIIPENPTNDATFAVGIATLAQ
jgi:hypothetical protein